ncbi:Mucin-like protein [Trichinella pseudospiralis]
MDFQAELISYDLAYQRFLRTAVIQSVHHSRLPVFPTRHCAHVVKSDLIHICGRRLAYTQQYPFFIRARERFFLLRPLSLWW